MPVRLCLTCWTEYSVCFLSLNMAASVEFNTNRELCIKEWVRKPEYVVYGSGIQPGVRVPLGVREDILGVRKI
jgi:hypothetical protein